MIENELDQVWTQLSNNQQAVLSKINETKDSAQKELNEHRTALEETKKQLEKFSVGGLDLEIVGLVWLFIGITAATIPDELLRVFK